jgi:hypothetical protein
MLILIRLCPYSDEIEKHFEKGRGQVGLFISLLLDPDLEKPNH